MDKNICLLTVTWAGDRDNFLMLRRSLEKSALGGLRHDVVVQTEDLQLFKGCEYEGVGFFASKDILPKDVDRRRQRSRVAQERYGRSITRICTSLARYSGCFDWSRYLGWQIQQLSKLAYVAASDCDLVVVIDSDVIVTKNADLSLFLNAGTAPCFERYVPRGTLSGKAGKWVETAESLFGRSESDDHLIGSYFDTPFVMSPQAVRDLLEALEYRFDKPWWQVLLGLEPRRWSEFAIYKNFLRTSKWGDNVEWIKPDKMGVIFDLSRQEHVIEQFNDLQDAGCHYITLHSQASGRHSWSASAYKDEIFKCL